MTIYEEIHELNIMSAKILAVPLATMDAMTTGDMSLVEWLNWIEGIGPSVIVKSANAVQRTTDGGRVFHIWSPATNVDQAIECLFAWTARHPDAAFYIKGKEYALAQKSDRSYTETILRPRSL